MADELLPPIPGAPELQPVTPPPGSPDHARKGGAAVEPVANKAAPVEAPPLVAVLDFVADRAKHIPLDFPFRFEGRLIEAIDVKRLPMAAVNNLVSSDRYLDLYEIYAEMTGLPASVLRGLDGDDGTRVTEIAFDFLPRLLAKVSASTST
jgi:hypothetical protein